MGDKIKPTKLSDLKVGKICKYRSNYIQLLRLDEILSEKYHRYLEKDEKGDCGYGIKGLVSIRGIYQEVLFVSEYLLTNNLVSFTNIRKMSMKNSELYLSKYLDVSIFR